VGVGDEVRMCEIRRRLRVLYCLIHSYGCDGRYGIFMGLGFRSIFNVLSLMEIFEISMD